MLPTTLSHVARARVRLVPAPELTSTADRLPPPGYAVAILADGRAAPLGIVPYQCSDQEHTQDGPPCGVYTLDWQFEVVPPASGYWGRSGIIVFPTYADACRWCRRRQENASLLNRCQEQATQAECYPERSVWYREEIERLLRETGYHWPCRTPDGPFLLVVYATDVSLWIHASSPYLPTFSLHLQASNPDDAWEQAYAAVVKICGKSRK
jgi:hypothetical protein